MEKANNVSDKGSSLTEKIKDLLPIEIQDFVTGDDILNLTKSSNLSEELTLLISNLDVDVNVNIQELCQEIEKIIAKSKQPNNVAKPMNKSVQIIDLLRKTLGSYANFITTEYIEKAAHKLLRCNILSLRDEINLFIKNSNEEIKRLTYNDPSITLRANVDELFTSIKKIREQKEEIKDTIFSDNALKDIQKYLLVESKSHKTNDLVNFSGGNVKNSEVTDNRYSRFSLQQINLMLSNGVSPSCLHDINDFDTFIRFNCLTDDINKRSISDLHPSFIEFLYIESNSNGEHLSKASTVDQLTKDFMQKLISKYIQDKNLSSVEKIDGNPIIKFLFFKGDGTLRDKKEINKLLGSDEEIFEMLMKAKVSWMLILDIINNYHIDLQLSENWLSKLEEKHEFDEYIFLAYTVKQKKLMTFRLEDLLGNKNQKVNDLLAGKEVKEDECTLKFTDKQIELAKAIKIIAGDLQTIKEYFQQNKDNKENNTKEDKLKKLFNHQFLYNNLLDQIFFTSLVTFFKEEIFSDLSDQIDDAVNTEDWRKVFEHKAISHFLKNLKSDFIISILLLRFLESSFFKNTDVNSFAEFLIVLFDSVKEAEHQNENQNQENNIEKKMENNENNNVATNTSKSDQLISEDRATIYASLHERNKNHNNLSENKIEQNIIDNKELKITNEEQNNQKDEKDKIAIKRVFIKTFVAKAKDINRHLTRGGGTLLSYIFDNLNNINQSFKSRVKKYEFNEDDRNYFIACCNEFKVELKNSGNDKNKNQNVISDSKNKNQNSMDEIVSNFLSGKFDTKEDKSKSKNEIVKVNPIKPKEEVHDKKKTSNMFDYTKITNRNLSGFNYKEQSVPSENNTQIKKGGNIISENDYLDDETFNEFMQNHNDDNPKARNYEDIKDEDRKKTDLMKSECMATLYEIDVNIVTHIANLDQCTLNVTDNGFYDSLNNIFKNISNNDDKYKNLIKKCYINLFFFGKEFKALASVYYRSDKALKFFESKFENRFESNEDDKERTILGDKYIEYFRTTWDKRKSYLDEQIKLIGRKSTADLDDEFELYSQLQKNYDLNKEISKSNVEGKLDKYNFPGYDFHTGKNDFYADFIQHIGKKVEDFYCSSFENFFFGYLCVMKNISQKYNITNKYLPEFQKCYIQKFLLWHRDNEKSEKINRQFLLDMYFFFNKDKNSGKPQNIFGEGIKNYFYDCVKEWFNVEDKDLTFDAKLKYIQSSVVDEIQFLEMDQIEKSGIRIIESPDKEREEKEFKQISALIISNNIKDKKESQNEVNVDQNSNSETIRLHREEFFKRNNNHSETNTIEKIKDNYNVEKNDHISENNSSNFNIQKEINNQQDETNKPKNLTETKSEDRNNPEEKEKNDSKNKYINTTGQPKNINVMKNNNNISTNGGSINRQPDVDESMKTEKEKEKDNSKNKKIDKQNYVRSYKIKFWISMMSMFLFCGAIYFSIYFVVFVFINLAFSTFYFKKQKDHKQQISKKFDITNDSVDYKVKTNEDKNQDFIPSMIKDSIDLENKVNG